MIMRWGAFRNRKESWASTVPRRPPGAPQEGGMQPSTASRLKPAWGCALLHGAGAGRRPAPPARGAFSPPPAIHSSPQVPLQQQEREAARKAQAPQQKRRPRSQRAALLPGRPSLAGGLRRQPRRLQARQPPPSATPGYPCSSSRRLSQSAASRGAQQQQPRLGVYFFTRSVVRS